MSRSGSIVVGRKPVQELLRERLAEVDCVFLNRDLDSPEIHSLRKLCASSDVVVKFVPPGKLHRLAEGANHQGVVAVISPVVLHDLDDILRQIAPTRDDVERKKPLLVLPAGITDPHNLGAVVRSAVAFGSSAILLPDRGNARIGTTVMKASAGTALRIPFARVPNTSQALIALKERGYWIAGLAGDGETKLDEMDWYRPVVIVVGSESKGLPSLIKRDCDFLVAIPISSEVESLNASVATGIALQAASRHR